MTPHESRAAIALIILTLVATSALVWRWVDQHTVISPQPGGELREGIVGNPRTANALLAINETDLDLATITQRGLFLTNTDGNTLPDLAESYSISDDHKTYHLTLSKNLKWSDGEPLTTADVIFTIQSIQNPQLKSPLADSFRDVTVAAEGERGVIFTLKEPYAPFVQALTVGLVPSHIWKSIPWENWLSAETNLKPVGTGPFRFRSLVKDKGGALVSYVLEPNPFTHTTLPKLQKIVLRFYPDTLSAIDGLKQGVVDAVGGVPVATRLGLNPSRFTTYELNLPQYTAVFYNAERNQLLSDRSVRQALSAFINRPALIQEALGGQARPARGPFTVGQFMIATSGQATSYDPDKAQTLLADAGWQWPQPTEPRNKNGSPLEFTLTVVDNDEQLKVANNLKQQWAAAGLIVNLEVVPAYRLQHDVILPRSYQALLASEIVGLDPDLYPFWHSSQSVAPGLNLAQFQNREVDDLLAEARQTLDEQARLDRYIKIADILRAESPATFLFSTTYSYVVSKRLSGPGANIIGQPADRFNGIELWYSKTKRLWR